MEVKGYTKEFDAELETNNILQEKYEKIRKLHESQFASYYSTLTDFSAINNVMAKRTLGYHTLLDSLMPGSEVYTNLNKFNFGIHKLMSTRMLKGLKMAPQKYVGSRGTHRTLHDLITELNINVILDEILIVDHTVDSGKTILELRGSTTEIDYSNQTALNIDTFPLNWCSYPLKTGLISPIVTTDLNYTYNFENVIEALMMDRHPFMDQVMGNNLTVKENYAIVNLIERITSNSMNESITSDTSKMSIYTTTYMPFIGSKFFIRTICTKYNIQYNQKVNDFLINFFAELDYSNPVPTYSSLINDDNIDSIIKDIKNKQFFYNLIIYISNNDIYKDQYTLFNNIPGASDDLYSRLTELIMLKQYGLMWFKLYSKEYDTTMQLYTYILDNSDNPTKMYNESTIILESIKNLYNAYFKSLIGLSFIPFDQTMRPKVAAQDFIDNLDDSIPFYIKLLEISPIDRINTRILLDSELFGGTTLSRNTTINVNVKQIHSQPFQIHTIDLNNQLTSKSTATYNTLIYYNHNIYFKSIGNDAIVINNSLGFKLYGTTNINFNHNIDWFSNIVLNSLTKNTWDLFVLNSNSNDIDPDSTLLDNWGVIDPDETDLSVSNFEYGTPIADHVTGLTSRGHHSNFRLEVTLSSLSDAANDIGVVLARNTSVSEKNLTVVRSNNDHNTWRLIYNWGMLSEKVLIDNSSNVAEVGDDSSGSNYWNNNSDVKIIIERVGNVIKANTSTWDDDSVFNDDSIISIDLINDNFPDFDETNLSDLYDKGSIGFSCYNMTKVRYTDIFFKKINSFSF